MKSNKWSNKTFNIKNPPNWNCPSCTTGILIVDPAQFHFEETRLSKETRDEIFWSPDFTIYLFHGTLRCNSCNDIVTIAGKGSVDHIQINDAQLGGYFEEHNDIFTPLYFYPPLKLITIPKNCPKNISKEINDSFGLFWYDLPSCANKIRVSLELLMNRYKVKKTFMQSGKRKRLSLHKRIFEFKRKKPEIAELLLAIKWIGNTGSHIGKLENVDLLEAYELLEHSLNKLFDSTEKKLQKISREINRREGTRKRNN